MASKHTNFTIFSRNAVTSPHFYLRVYTGEYEDPHAHVYSKMGKELGRLRLSKKAPKNSKDLKPFHGTLSKTILLDVWDWVQENAANWENLWAAWNPVK